MEIDFVPSDGSDVNSLPKGTEFTCFTGTKVQILDASCAADGGLRSYNRQYWADIIALLNGSILMHDAEVFMYRSMKKK